MPATRADRNSTRKQTSRRGLTLAASFPNPTALLETSTKQRLASLGVEGSGFRALGLRVKGEGCDGRFPITLNPKPEALNPKPL